MTRPSETADGSASDDCAELRAAVGTHCAEARRVAGEHEASVEHIRKLRRDLVTAQHQQEEAIAAADPGLRAAEKAHARESYELARGAAKTDEERTEATATWARALDRINRSGRLAQRAASRAGATLSGTEEALRVAERHEQSVRVLAEQAQAACLDARVRLASCEEDAQSRDAVDGPAAGVTDPHAATGAHAVAISDGGLRSPLVIESMVSGDRLALDLAARRIAERTDTSPAEAQLQLQELVDAIVSAASDDGYLIFDTAHSFWSGLSFEEARDVIAALARLGFVLEPREGWHAGRAPAPSDLSMALAYAGHDPRNMRDLPNADDLRQLPSSIDVDARSFLAAQAPDLTVDHMVRILDRRADQLEALWNEWGQVRPILLSDRHSLGTVEG